MQGYLTIFNSRALKCRYSTELAKGQGTAPTSSVDQTKLKHEQKTKTITYTSKSNPTPSLPIVNISTSQHTHCTLPAAW
jgi:hypothetical protein